MNYTKYINIAVLNYIVLKPLRGAKQVGVHDKEEILNNI